MSRAQFSKPPTYDPAVMPSEPRNAPRFWPIEPLLEALDLSLVQVASDTGWNARTTEKVRTEGLTDNMADRLAIGYGVWPIEVWGIEYVLPPEDSPVAAWREQRLAVESDPVAARRLKDRQKRRRYVERQKARQAELFEEAS